MTLLLHVFYLFVFPWGHRPSLAHLSVLLSRSCFLAECSVRYKVKVLLQSRCYTCWFVPWQPLKFFSRSSNGVIHYCSRTEPILVEGLLCAKSRDGHFISYCIPPNCLTLRKYNLSSLDCRYLKRSSPMKPSSSQEVEYFHHPKSLLMHLRNLSFFNLLSVALCVTVFIWQNFL